MAEAPGYVEGWTEAIEYDLKHGETPAVFDAGGMSLDLVLTNARGQVVDYAGVVEWANQSQSRARFRPAAGDFIARNGPYRARWIVTDSGGDLTPFPEGPGLIWNIFEV